MADIWFDVDVAISEAPITISALIDDTDFKTREESVVYNQAGLDLVWNFVTTAGAMTQTAVTPTDTAGNYDWVSQGNGLYTIEIPASGGASINNNTEGFGWFTGFATGILPWRGPIIGFRAAALNNALIDGGDTLDVNVTEWLGTAAATPTTAGVPEVDVTFAAGTAVQAASGRFQVDAELVNGVTPETAASIADAVWDEDATGHQTQGTFGQAIGDPVNDADTIWTLVNTNLDSQVSLVSSDVMAEIVEGTTTLVQSVRGINSATMGKTTDTGGVRTYRDLADTKDRITATVDTGDRTAITLDLT